MSDEISPFTRDIPQTDLGDLMHRLAQTRWPDKSPVEDGRQGPPPTKIEALNARRAEPIAQSFAKLQGAALVFERDLLNRLRQREFSDTSALVAAKTGLQHLPTRNGDSVGGI